ncbi:MAG: glycosyltransferase family 2 protein [Christensenellales bacterium]|jgi:tetratricopeptide (TPR) repeat protein
MRALKICVYAICKNEVAFVDRWMDSMSEADAIIVTDTGSTDGTIEALKRRGAVVHHEKVEPWRFDAARNLSLNHVPTDADICVCTDLDERFVPGWRAKLEQAWRASIAKSGDAVARSGRYLYNWSLKPDGSPDVQFYYFKVHERRGFRWVCPVHEYVRYEGALPHEAVTIEGMILNHYPDQTKSRASYLPLLELGVSENPADERMRYYLGREYFYKARWADCVGALTAYLNLPTATWREERCAAMRWIARAHRHLEDREMAKRWFYQAIAELPDMREPYVEFAQMSLGDADWAMAFFLAQESLKIKEKSRSYVNMGYAWDHTPDDICAVAAYRLGMQSAARMHAARALAYAPDDARLQENLRRIEAASTRR